MRLYLRFALRTFARRIVHAVLLRPLRNRDPARLVAVWITSTREESLAKLFVTYADYVGFRGARTLEKVGAAHRWRSMRGLTSNAAADAGPVPRSGGRYGAICSQVSAMTLSQW